MGELGFVTEQEVENAISNGEQAVKEGDTESAEFWGRIALIRLEAYLRQKGPVKVGL